MTQALEKKEAVNARPRRTATPRADVFEDGGNTVLLLDVPGADEKTLELTLENGVLSVSAGVTSAPPEGYRPAREDRAATDYRRSFELGDSIDQAGVTAHLKNGVLKIVLPSAPETKPKKITISTN